MQKDRIARPAMASLLLSVFWLAVPPAARPDEAARPEESAGPASAARKALLSGDYAAAIEGFKKIAAGSGPADPQGKGGGSAEALAARRGWAEGLAAIGKYEEALETLRADPKTAESPLLSNLAGAILFRLGKLAEARSTLEKEPPEGEGLAARVERLVRLGQADAASGKLAEARAAFEKSIELYKEMDSAEAEKLPAETFVQWGQALIGLNRWDEANKVMFQQAEEKDSKCGSLLLERGRAFLAKYNFPDSRDFFKEAIKENPRFVEALAALADNDLTDFSAGPQRFEEAEKSIAAALAVNERSPEAYLARGSLWLYDGNYGRAAADLERSLRENPASLKARGLLAACRFLLGDQKGFAAEEEAARAVNPKGAEFYHTVAVALDQRFRYFDAVAMCDRALSLDPDYWPAYWTLGINCLRTGENARGRQFLDRSWEKDKFNVWVFNTRKLIKFMDENYTSLEDGGFVFYFPKADAAVLTAYLVPLLKDAKRRFEARYRTPIEGPIQVEDFSQHQWFSTRTVGLPDFPASGACFGKLVTLTTPKAIPQNWGAVAWHEFAHVAALKLTAHRVPRWLTEGLSVYEEGLDHPHWARNFQRDLADAWASKRLLPLSELDFGFSKPKYPQQILNSYFQGCVIVRLIVERWNFDKILEILKGYREGKNTPQIFSEALALSLEEFDRQFETYMARWVEGNGYRPRLEKEMMADLETQTEKDPKDVKAEADLAWAYFCSGNEVDAPLAAEKALALDPKCGDAQAVLGFLSLKAKRKRAAMESLEKALAAGTRFAATCHAQLGSLLAKERESRQKAIEHLEEAKKLSPIAVAGHPQEGNSYYQLAKLYEEAGDEERANQQMVELARFAVEDGECRQRIVRYALEVKKDPRMALKYLDELLYIAPFEPKFHRYLAKAAAEVGDQDIAIRENQLLLTFADANPRAIRLALARAFLLKGEKQKAAAEARRLLDLDPDHGEAKDILRQAEAK
jgi:tetratricopeptide (TPR) repeat protein